ncbi:response regulator transcription factor [Marinifilum caeruleilacunae]|uniref:Response regulator transcription factor n=1 Tax=Marinifilum caeruleilacunae TaxID=2499076 RepID=A0ABX1X0U9_9BACT|nr:response regulator transcription factor [Marinifilum caeruleilacunae]NOU62028.1 response regulator transcription factor [Marinifilum caeruleilacunae]
MKKLQILFVDDDINLGNLISSVLETDYNCQVHFQNTMIGIEYIIKDLKPDIIILDVEIGTVNSISKAKEIVENHPQIPLLFISSHTDDELITKGIGIGAYAYIPKPLSIPLLVTYIKRFTSESQQNKFIELARYTLNLNSSELHFDSVFVKKLSPSEKVVLELLMRQPNKIVKKEQVIEKLCTQSLETPGMASLHNIISKIRELLKLQNTIEIGTIRGVGYILKCEE